MIFQEKNVLSGLSSSSRMLKPVGTLAVKYLILQFLQVDRQSEILEVREYEGFTVIDTTKDKKYTVADFYDNPGNPLLLLKSEGNEVMLPVNADYILSVDISGKMIKAAFPDGLV